MTRLAFTVAGEPVPWERTAGNGKRRFTSPRTRDYQSKIRAAALGAGAVPLPGLVRVRLAFYRSTKRRCDWDNLAKTVCDALNGLAFADDSQIVEASVAKHLDRDAPRVEAEIEPLTEAGEEMLRASRHRVAAAGVNEVRRELRSILGRKPLEKLNRGRLKSSVKRYATADVIDPEDT